MSRKSSVIKVENIEKIPDHLKWKLYCPKCDSLPTSWTVIKTKKKTRSGVKEYKYIIFTHYSLEDRELHRWCFALLNEENLKYVDMLGLRSHATYVSFEGNEIEEFVKLLSSTRKVSKKIVDLINVLAGAKKVLIRVYY